MAGTSGDDPTQLRAETPTVTGPRTPSGSYSTRLGPSSSTGWLSSSGSIDHGRFPPGTILDNRYRVVGLLGRGGMGEVYRADDLRLGQPVALKFLPDALERDPARLAQFHNEVRIARQVSHPNVCRVYDIGEADGQPFLTMEYVDGEDLASLLRRIGRLPEDKAIEIARQICAGLAAAHERGVLHRDLKPANIMIDGAGRVRITDFGLAGGRRRSTDIARGHAGLHGAGAAGRHGGHGPERHLRAGPRALRAVHGPPRVRREERSASSIEQHESGTITAPTSLVQELDPAIERAILRCLERDPARRPASALAVAAALPGGDPLAAALAAGETPSPEMVAAVGGDSATLAPAGRARLARRQRSRSSSASPRCTIWTSLLARMPLSKPLAVLLDRAEEIRQSLGFADAPVDQASGLSRELSELVEVAGIRSIGLGGSPRWSTRVDSLLVLDSASPIVPVNPYSNVTPDDPAFVWTDTSSSRRTWPDGS